MIVDLDSTANILKVHLPAPPSVLIVDDDDLVLARLRELVTAAGYLARTASSGAEALQMLETTCASIVITDLDMAGMDGLELCRHIRARDWPGYVYIVLLTIRDQEKDILAGLEAGADDYLSKRTSAAHFMARLRTAKRILELEYSLKCAVEMKRQLAMTDPLTGIYNRRYFMRHLTREMKRSLRFGGDVALLLLDVDNFKNVNDTHGHLVGDRVLLTLTQLMCKSARRATDWCARLGGDEFALVLEGTTLQEAHANAETLRESIADCSIDTTAGSVRITVSIGVSSLGCVADRAVATVHTLLEGADRTLYSSKARGRNRVTLANLSSAALPSCDSAHLRAKDANAKLSVRSVR